MEDNFYKEDPLEKKNNVPLKDIIFPVNIDVERVFKGLFIVTISILFLGLLMGILIGVPNIEPIGTWFAATTNFVVLMWVSTGLFFQSYQTHLQSKQIGDQLILNEQTIQSIQLQIALSLYNKTNKALARVLREIASVYEIFPLDVYRNAADRLNEGHCDPIADLFLSDKKISSKLKIISESHPSFEEELNEFINLYETLQSKFLELSIPENIKHIMIDTSLFKQVYILIKEVV